MRILTSRSEVNGVDLQESGFRAGGGVFPAPGTPVTKQGRAPPVVRRLSKDYCLLPGGQGRYSHPRTGKDQVRERMELFQGPKGPGADRSRAVGRCDGSWRSDEDVSPVALAFHANSRLQMLRNICKRLSL